MILVDTSVWVDHLHVGDKELAGLLNNARVLTHPFVVGELACGNLRKRREVLTLLQHLPQAPVATNTEALFFIKRHRLMGRGVGYIDVHLLTAISLTGSARLWTRDKRLAEVAAALRLAHKG